MNRRQLAAGLGIALFPGVVQAAPKEETPEEKRMNVLFLLADDLRPTLGCYSDPYALTPAIDSLAARGVVFRNAYCQQAVSNPSRASLLTGWRPDRTGVTDLYTNFREKNPRAVTLPQLFRNNGYYTVGTGKIFHALKGDVDRISWTEMHYLERRGYLLEGSLPVSGGKGVSHEGADVPDDNYPDGEIADKAVRLIEKAAQRKEPFFLAVGFLKPHLPFNAPKRYWDLYADTVFGIDDRERPVQAPEIAFHNSNELRGYTDVPKQGSLPDSLAQRLWQGYYACVSYVDAQIGKVMAALEANGLADNTLIVLLGDHGYHLGEQDLWCKSTNFELDTRIPLIVRVPGEEGSGRVETSLVEAVDLYATLADYCSLEVPQHTDGVSLRGLIQGSERNWNYNAYSQFIRPYRAISKPVKTHMGYSVRTPLWRYTAWYELDTGRADRTELYLLGANGVETRNLSGERAYADLEAELSRLVEAYRNGNYEK